MRYLVIGSLGQEDQIRKIVKENQDRDPDIDIRAVDLDRQGETTNQALQNCLYYLSLLPDTDVVIVVLRPDRSIGEGALYKALHAVARGIPVIYIPSDQS